MDGAVDVQVPGESSNRLKKEAKLRALPKQHFHTVGICGLHGEQQTLNQESFAKGFERWKSDFKASRPLLTP